MYYFNEEVSSTEPSPSVSVPWIEANVLLLLVIYFALIGIDVMPVMFTNLYNL